MPSTSAPPRSDCPVTPTSSARMAHRGGPVAILPAKTVCNAYLSVRPSFHLQQACNGKPIRLDNLDFIYRDGKPTDLFSIADIDIKIEAGWAQQWAQ
jgi:hypothetical protein